MVIKKMKILLFMIFAALLLNAQESNNGKKIWAKSFLNKKAPEIVVEKWLTEKPDFKGKFVLVDFGQPGAVRVEELFRN